MKVGILGSGAWGTALAQVLDDNGHEVTIYAVVEKQRADLAERHRNSAYFQDTPFSPSIRATGSLKEAVEGMDAVVIAVPTFAVGEVTSKADACWRKDAILITVSKGFDPATKDLMGQVIAKRISSPHPIVALAGPSFAAEVVRRDLTAVTAASKDLQAAKAVQRMFSNGYFRVYTNEDEIGAESAGAIKNVVAIAAGVVSGMGYGANARAGLITRGLSEMGRFVEAMGGKVDTIYGLTGVGDLLLTCSSEESRNFRVGFAIGKTSDAAKVLSDNTLTSEGVKASQLLHEKAVELGVDMPICEAVYKTLYEGEDPKEVVDGLMSRPLSEE